MEQEEKWWAKGRHERIQTHEFMIGWHLAQSVYPKYGLTDKEKAVVRESVAETLCGLTPYKDWLDAAEKTCRVLVKVRESDRS